jgi:Transposase IS66 family
MSNLLLFADRIQCPILAEALLARFPNAGVNAGEQRRLRASLVTNRDIPATNNSSERALRPCAVFRKITNGFRTEWGAKLYAEIRSVIETARRRSIGALEAIRLTLAGTPLADST